MWPALTILACVALVALHFWWRRRFRLAEESAARDLEAIKQQQQQSALEQQTQQDAIFNSMQEGLLLLDKSGRIQMANRAFAELFDGTDDVRGKLLLEAVRWHEVAELVGRLGPEQTWITRELRFPGPSELWLQVSVAMISNPEGGRQGTLLVFHDLTRLKQLERTREEFIANVSHELRTPLSHIKGYTETLLGGAKDEPEVATRFLQTIARNAERLQLLIEDLLTISELESGRVTLKLQPLPLQSVVEKVCDDFKTRADAKTVTLTNTASGVKVSADAVRLEQVLSNLVDNAIKYGRTGGHVIVSARSADDGKVEISVQDDGPGLPADSLERVFERFYRVDKGRSREQGGTGLGLAIVKHIVQSHGGTVWAKSKAGKGTTFYFTLPVAG
jgi:two-component system phosphate regulon sensor histidine kinase PhoR